MLSRTAVLVALVLTLAGCSGSEPGPASPDRSSVESRISAAPPADVTITPAQPDAIELRTPDGATYLSSPVDPDGLFRVGQVLNPVNELPAWWAESGLPGSTETVVVVGHNYSKRDAPFKALRVVQPGDSVLLQTANGTVEYAVQSVGPLQKGSLLGDNDLRKSVPGRLILANCDVIDGEPTDDNYIVVAQSRTAQ